MNVQTARLEEIYFAALECASPTARAAFLDAACGTDSELRRQVELLLDAHSKVGSFLERPAVGPTINHQTTPVLEGPGAKIGPYKLLEQIGVGGMGVVYMAEQVAPIRRKVALKIIKPGMDTKQVIARFEAERQALALMDHANIARVLDAATTDSGRPYFVMELVRGIPITEYCDKNHLSIDDRLDLFVQVCQAVQHAHQKGIIHRDIKPSNILITLHDGVPVPKVIDFGIAKATGQALTDKTVFTAFAQFIGTPMYMSPEQAEMSGLDIDTRCDIYALGVLLYELLTGTTPFDRDTFRTAAFDEIRRIIREQEPARPSARISTLGATLTTVSANRHADSRALGKSMRGELDWIVMKALEKDRRRRYETASSFAADVMRYLADQPVEACPPSALYRFRKLGRRNRAALITAGIIALVLIAGTAVSTWQAIRATQAERLVREARDEARRRAEETQQVVDFLASDVFGAAAPEKSHGKAVTVFDILATSDASISARFGKQPLVEAAVRMAMGEAYSAVLQYDKAERQFARAAALRARHLGPEHPDTLQAEDRQASQFSLPQRKEKYEAGEPLARHVLEARRRVLGPEHPKTVDAMRQLVEFLRGVGRLDEALALAEQGFEIETRLHGPSSIEATRMGAALARVLADRRNPRDLERAEALTRKVVEALTRLDPDNTNTFWTTRDLARMIRAQGRTKEARQLYQENLERSCRAFGIDSIETSNALELTGLLHEERDTVALRDLYERLLREDLATPQPKDPYWRSRRSAMLSGLTLGLVTLPEPIAYDTSLTLQGSQEAAALMEMVAADSSARSTYRAELAETCYRLGRIYAKRSEWTEANAAIERSFGLLESFDTSSRPAPLQENQENAANESGQIANACNNVAWFLATDPDPRLRNHPRALDLAQRAVASAPDTAMFWNTLGVAYYRAGEWTKAMAALEKSLAFQAGHEGFDWIFLAMAHQQLGEKDKARARYDKAVVWIEKNRPQDEELRRFREEAAELLGLMKTSDPNGGEPPQ